VQGDNELRETIRVLRHQINEAESTLDKLDTLTKEELSLLSEWEARFKDIDEKLHSVEEVLVEPGKI